MTAKLMISLLWGLFYIVYAFKENKKSDRPTKVGGL